MEVSIIIVNWNTRDILRDCLDSFYETKNNLSYEIIVVDNASTDDSVKMIVSDYPEVKVIQNNENRGFAAGNNQGILEAKGTYVLLLNTDTIILDNAITKMVRFADAHPESAIVGCRVLNKNRTLRSTRFMYPSVLNMILSTVYLNKIFSNHKFFGRERMSGFDADHVHEPEVVSGCCMLARKEAIQQVGMLDEQYFMYGEETDWCYRFAKTGWKISFTPDAEIIHLGGASSRQRKPEMLLQLKGSILLFMKKHKNRISYAFSCLLVSLFFFLRAPWWACYGLFSRKNRRSKFVMAYTYLRGTIRALRGAKKLCLNR